MLIPDFVAGLGAAPNEWVERDDRLNAENQNLGFNERNQRDWWIQNRKIRSFFVDLTRLVEGKIRRGESPSNRWASWSYIARELKCDRATLKHPRRRHWVDARRAQILSLIEDSICHSAGVQAMGQSKASEADQLKVQLAMQRTQTALWCDKCVRLEQQVAQLTRLLDIRNTKIKGLLAAEGARNQQL